MKIFGFPQMDLIKGIRRSYPPHLILAIAKSNILLNLEEGYGEDTDRLTNIEIYASQIKPILQFLIDNGIEGIDIPKDFKTSALNDALYESLNPLNIANKK